MQQNEGGSCLEMRKYERGKGRDGEGKIGLGDKEPF